MRAHVSERLLLRWTSERATVRELQAREPTDAAYLTPRHLDGVAAWRLGPQAAVCPWPIDSMWSIFPLRYSDLNSVGSGDRTCSKNTSKVPLNGRFIP